MTEQPDDTKLGELLLLLAEGLSNEASAGSTKLNKLAFYAEFTHMRTHGRPITGVKYQRLPNGPAPRRLVPVRDQLIASGDAELREEGYLGLVQHRLVPKRKARTELFTESELQAIADVLEALGSKSGSTLSELSHEDPGWLLVDDGDVIPYETAFLRNGSPGKRAIEHGRELAARHAS